MDSKVMLHFSQSYISFSTQPTAARCSIGGASHLVPPKPPLAPPSMTSDDEFLADERACATLNHDVGEITSLSSKGDPDDGDDHDDRLALHSNPSQHHHSNPLYTDNEYESMMADSRGCLLESTGDLVDGNSRMRHESDNDSWDKNQQANMDEGLRWLQDVSVAPAPTKSNGLAVIPSQTGPSEAGVSESMASGTHS